MSSSSQAFSGALRSGLRFRALAADRALGRKGASLVAVAGVGVFATSSSTRRLCAAASEQLPMANKQRVGAGSEWEKRASGSSKIGVWFHAPDLALRDLYFVVPLDYSSPQASSITIFAREVVTAGKEEHKIPYLLFLQGGPGFECPRPADSGGWLKKACEEYRVILLDQALWLTSIPHCPLPGLQRGTGLSTPLTATALSQFTSAQQQASHLQHFRADNIVRDAEYVRSRLLPGGETWTVLGQSFGGFCAVTYLSIAPHGLRQVLLTGGLPPVGDGCTADLVYRQCYERVVLQNAKYYTRFPQDEEVVRCIILHLAEATGGGISLPSGGMLSPRGLQVLGLYGLGSSGGFERLHYLLERAWDPVLVPDAKKRLSHTFLRMVENWLDFDTNPLYALLHEACYCQGAASKWSAHRIRGQLGSQFDAVQAASNCQRVLFTGEMIYPWMFDEVKALQPFKEAANILAEKEDWALLYDLNALRTNKVPVAAAVYYEDMYVNFKLAEATASEISGIRTWVTNEYMHSGIREDGPRILEYLFGLLKESLEFDSEKRHRHRR